MRALLRRLEQVDRQAHVVTKETSILGILHLIIVLLPLSSSQNTTLHQLVCSALLKFGNALSLSSELHVHLLSSSILLLSTPPIASQLVGQDVVICAMQLLRLRLKAGPYGLESACGCFISECTWHSYLLSFPKVPQHPLRVNTASTS